MYTQAGETMKITKNLVGGGLSTNIISVTSNNVVK